MSTKTCSACKKEKPLSDFSHSLLYKDGLRGQCKRCRAAYTARYRRTEAGIASALRNKKIYPERPYWLRKKYGLTPGEWSNILERQGGKCAICQSAPSGRKRKIFCVDHCHQTGVVRGLLCYRCNSGLTRFGDSYEGIKKALDYLSTSKLSP